jgi:uncharacterized protein YceK
MRITGRIILVCATLGFSAVGLSGCASVSAVAAQGNEAPATFEQSASQVDALADGVVNRAEYQAGFAHYRACMAKSGYPVTVLDGDSTIIDMRIPAEAVDNGIDNRCYQTEFMSVNEAWQIANQDQLADNVLLDDCLTDRRMAVPETRQEKVDALLNAKVDLGSCLKGK